MKTRIIVAGIIQDGERILLGKKDKGKPPYPNVWHTIGGGIKNLKAGEKLLKQRKYNDPYFHKELIRELNEEAPNLRIDPEKISCIIPRYRQVPREDITNGKDNTPLHMIFLEYFCKYAGGSTTASDDIAKLNWFNISDLKNVKLTPPSQEMYREIGWI